MMMMIPERVVQLLIRKICAPPPPPTKRVARMAWQDDPANLLVEDPDTGVWMAFAPWMEDAYYLRLDPFMCDPDPEDLDEDDRARHIEHHDPFGV